MMNRIDDIKLQLKIPDIMQRLIESHVARQVTSVEDGKPHQKRMKRNPVSAYKVRNYDLKQTASSTRINLHGVKYRIEMWLDTAWETKSLVANYGLKEFHF